MTPEQVASADRINAAIEAEVAQIASEGEMDMPVLNAYALVAEWVDLSKEPGDPDRIWTSRLKKRGISDMHMNGLFHEGLYGDWGG